jgi:hypothetical protein
MPPCNSTVKQKKPSEPRTGKHSIGGSMILELL